RTRATAAASRSASSAAGMSVSRSGRVLIAPTSSRSAPSCSAASARRARSSRSVATEAEEKESGLMLRTARRRIGGAGPTSTPPSEVTRGGLVWRASSLSANSPSPLLPLVTVDEQPRDPHCRQRQKQEDQHYDRARQAVASAELEAPPGSPERPTRLERGL